jgi:hypothetical protein
LDFNLIHGKLIKLDSAVLADALMTLALESSSAAMMVERLAADIEERIALFKDNLHIIIHPPKRSRISGYTILDTLRRTLELLDPQTMPLEIGLELMEAFYQTDFHALNSSTELDCEFGQLYHEVAFDVFAAFTLRCTIPELVIPVVKRLSAHDDYGMRENLLMKAEAFLPQPYLQKLFD